MEVGHAGRQTKKRRTRSQSAIAVNACTPSSSWQLLTLRSKPNHITNRQCSHIFHCNIGLCEIVRGRTSRLRKCEDRLFGSYFRSVNLNTYLPAFTAPKDVTDRV